MAKSADGVLKALDSVLDAGDTQIERAASSGVNKFTMEAQDIRLHPITLQDLYRGNLISDDAYGYGEKFLAVDMDGRKKFIGKDPKACVDFFSAVIENIKSDTSLQFILTVLSDVTEDYEVVCLLVSVPNARTQLCHILVNLFYRNDIYNKVQASVIFARLSAYLKEEGLSAAQVKEYKEDMLKYLSSTISYLGSQPDYLDGITIGLMTFLRTDAHREAFFNNNGIKPIVTNLDRRLTFQLQYQLIFCVWMLTFNETIIDKLKDEPVVLALCDVLRATSREKVKRVILAAFRNMLEKSTKSVADQFAGQMIHFKSLPVMTVMMKQTWQDADLQSDLEFLSERLNNSLQDMSSYDEYLTEVKSLRLEWSPVHSSDKFWRENVMKLNDNDHEVLKLLVEILQSQNLVSVAVAAHDLGEYVRFYPRGKITVEQLGGKEQVMTLVNSTIPEVRMQALLAIQKMMVQNWEYLGKQLETGKA